MRIWVARPEPGATRTAGRLLALGHEPLVAPVLTIAATETSPPEGPFDALLLTSANALARAERWRPFSAVPVFAVGERTAAAARAGGFVSVTSAEGDARAVANLVRGTMAEGAALLHAVGEDRKAEPAASLTEAGFRITTFVAYEARPVDGLPRAVKAAFDMPGAMAGMVHYSRRSAATARDLAVAAGYGGAFAALRHYCLSADVAVPLGQAGIAAHFVADMPNEDALLAGLEAGC